MSVAAGYRRYVEECRQLAQTATPVTRAHLLRVAATWLRVVEQMEQESGQDGSEPQGKDCLLR
jgi:hypothetical protein